MSAAWLSKAALDAETKRIGRGCLAVVEALLVLLGGLIAFMVWHH